MEGLLFGIKTFAQDGLGFLKIWLTNFCCSELGGFFFHHHFEIFHCKTLPILTQIKLAIFPQNFKNSN